MADLIFPAIVGLFLLGLGGLVFSRQIMKIVISLSLLQGATALLFVALGYRNGSGAPLFSLSSPQGQMSLPAPQAMAAAVLLMSALFTALLLALALLLQRRRGSDIDEIGRSL